MPDIQYLLDKYRINTSAEDLLERWEEPYRSYHGKGHLHDLFRQIEGDFQKGVVSQTEKEKLELVAIFHDIVYNPTRTDNEEQSADYLLSLCMRPDDPAITEVYNAILDTKEHVGNSRISTTFNNYDMNIVERDFDELLEWEQGIRNEYNMVDDMAYKAGRLRFLESLPAQYPANRNNLEKLIDWVKQNY
jgi:predicted metal-dependent HD superfamily phosphohydrolase